MTRFVGIFGKSRARAALVAAALAFTCAQFLTVGHAVQYGDEPHDHAGQVCVLSLASSGVDKLLGATAIVFAAVFFCLAHRRHSRSNGTRPH